MSKDREGRRASLAEAVDRLMAYLDARAKLVKAYSECEQSPAYYCRQEREDRDRALDRLLDAIESLTAKDSTNG